jgi:hypothetical protein
MPRRRCPAAAHAGPDIHPGTPSLNDPTCLEPGQYDDTQELELLEDAAEVAAFLVRIPTAQKNYKKQQKPEMKMKASS